MGANQLYGLIENGIFESVGLEAPVNNKNGGHIFPNTSDGNFTIEIANLQGESGTIEIFDITGKRVLSRQIEITSDHMSLSIGDLDAEIPAGTYTVNVVVNEVTHSSNQIVIVK